MKISLIITTYNWKEALRLSLESCLQQTLQPAEIIIADDGSGPDTAAVIANFAARSPIPVIHSWQEDQGFRLAASRNKAIAKSSGDYIILIDGDILLERHFIADHAHFARPKSFVQGTRVLLSAALSQHILAQACLPKSFCRNDVENKKNCIRSKVLSWLFSHRDWGRGGVRTCNFAFWREAAVKVNGFNEAFVGWGREDSEFTARLLHTGFIRRNIKFNALVYHLYHPQNDRSHLAENDHLLHRTVEQQSTWCSRGLDAYLSPEQKKAKKA
jgi:glycosyltransferase involved in cell wall biosynthesis